MLLGWAAIVAAGLGVAWATAQSWLSIFVMVGLAVFAAPFLPAVPAVILEGRSGWRALGRGYRLAGDRLAHAGVALLVGRAGGARAGFAWARQERTKTGPVGASARLADGRLVLTAWNADPQVRGRLGNAVRLGLLICDGNGCVPPAGGQAAVRAHLRPARQLRGPRRTPGRRPVRRGDAPEREAATTGATPAWSTAPYYPWFVDGE
jgi:hypothetical protein